MPQVSVDAEYLRRLLVKAALAPTVAKKGLLPSVLDDLTDRAMRSGDFSIGDATSELIGDPELYLDRLEAANTAPHLFHKQESKERERSLEKLTPLQRLQIANGNG